MVKRTPNLDKLLTEERRLTDVVGDDMLIYDITGVMDIPAQNAALLALGAVYDQILAEVNTGA